MLRQRKKVTQDIRIYFYFPFSHFFSMVANVNTEIDNTYLSFNNHSKMSLPPQNLRKLLLVLITVRKTNSISI